MISTSSTNKKLSISKLLIIAGAVLTLAIPFVLWQENSHIETDQSLSPFKMVTGFPCPGCGITKSFVSIYQGDVVKSFSYHLFGPIAFVLCFILIGILSVEIFTGKKYLRWLVYNKTLAYWLAGILMGYHLIRLINFISTHNIDQILKESIWK